MSRTRKREPSSSCWMRNPRHLSAERGIEATDLDLKAEGLPIPHRKAIPPNAWDDLLVSTLRGQPWHRKWRR